MGRRQFSGREIATVLRKHGYRPAGRTGSHLKLRWESPKTEEVRVVTVPMKSKDEISLRTLCSIADQCNATDFEAWCECVDANCFYVSGLSTLTESESGDVLAATF